MHIHRIWVAITVGWLFLLFNIERIYEPVNLASFVYVLATIDGALLLLSHRLRRAAPLGTLGLLIIGYLLLKGFLGYEVSLATLPLTLAEVAGLTITHLLMLHLGRATDEFADSTHQLLEVFQGRGAPDLKQAESQILGEIRRARRHGRPLSFVALSPGRIEEASFEELQRQLQAMLSREYLFGRLGGLLLQETKSHDVVARVGDKFLVLLPETTPGQAGQLAMRLRLACRTHLGVAAATRVLPFPDEELTLAGVLERLADAPPSVGLDEEPPTSRTPANECCLAEHC